MIFLSWMRRRRRRGWPVRGPAVLVGMPRAASVLGLTMQDLFPHRGVDETSRNGRKEKVSSTSNGHKRVFKTAAAAVKQLEKKLGQRALTWIYHDADGNPIGLIVRWDTEEGKEILPVSRNGTGWVIGGMPAPRPLYRLPELV
jgi:hypothetical protein